MRETCGLLEEVQLTYHPDLSGTNGLPGCILLLKLGQSQPRQTRQLTTWGVFQIEEEEDKGPERRACLAVSATSKEASVARGDEFCHGKGSHHSGPDHGCHAAWTHSSALMHSTPDAADRPAHVLSRGLAISCRDLPPPIWCFFEGAAHD